MTWRDTGRPRPYVWLPRLAAALIAIGMLLELTDVDRAPATNGGATSRAQADGDTGTTGTASPSTAAPKRGAGRGPARAEPRSVRANELGLVPILMYHRIRSRPQAQLDRTPRQLRRELTRLAREGYVPVTAGEYARGDIDIPAGRHPVVLTFDDSHPSHFTPDRRGGPRPGTAVAILREVAARHPGFRPVATLYVNAGMFWLPGDRRGDAVRWLRRQGIEIGNHTLSHPDLRRLGEARVAREIAGLQRLSRALGGGVPRTLALPFGSMPLDPSLARRGRYGSTRYRFDAVFLAGWRPAVSPFARGLDRGAVPRIQSGRSSECRDCSENWLDWLARHPHYRYTSDGDPRHVSFPRRTARWFSPVLDAEARPY